MRNSFHFIVGMLIAFLLSLTFDGLFFWEQFIIVVVVTWFFGASWEIAREMLKKSYFDWNDVYRTIIGGIVTILILAI